MIGFFDKKGIQNNGIDLKNKQSCASCGLYRNCLSPKMPPFGKNKKKIKKVMFLGEAPGETEDRRNKPWQGRVGSLLRIILKELNFDLFDEGVSLNAVNCRPPKNKTPTPNQIHCCRPKVLKAIKEYQPKVIVLLGNVAIQSLIGYRWKKNLGGITKWRGWCIPDQELNAWICPVYHPSFITRNEERNGENLSKSIWKRDLYNALQCTSSNHSIPKKPLNEYQKGIHYIKSNSELKRVIPKLIKAPLLSFDYETTGLKPHREEQEVVSVSAAVSENECYTWGNNFNDSVRVRLWKKVLKSKVPKTAHNIQFEEMWSRVKFGTEVKNWKICTMNGAHCLDNRKGVSGLKFQTYVNFGIPDYDSHISPWLSSDGELGSNSLNKIKEFIDKNGIDEILEYNALDSIFGLMLAHKQLGVIYGE